MNRGMMVLPTCEVSNDPESAIELGTGWGITNYELRVLWNNDRVPYITDAQKEHLKKVIAEYGVRIVTISPGLFIYKPATEEIAEQELSDKLPKSLEFAAEFGCSRIIIFGFARTEGVGNDFVVDKFGKAAEAARKVGCTLVVEPIGNSYCDNGADMGSIIRQVGSDHLKVNLDCGNFQYTGLTAYPDEYEHVKDLVEYVHVKNWSAARQQWALYDEGDIDLKTVLRRLKQDGYKGYLAMETHVRYSQPVVAKPIDAARKSCETLARWLDEI